MLNSQLVAASFIRWIERHDNNTNVIPTITNLAPDLCAEFNHFFRSHFYIVPDI